MSLLWVCKIEETQIPPVFELSVQASTDSGSKNWCFWRWFCIAISTSSSLYGRVGSLMSSMMIRGRWCFLFFFRAGLWLPLSSLLDCSSFGLCEFESDSEFEPDSDSDSESDSESASDSSMLGPAFFEPLWSGILKPMSSFSRIYQGTQKTPYLFVLAGIDQWNHCSHTRMQHACVHSTFQFEWNSCNCSWEESG